MKKEIKSRESVQRPLVSVVIPVFNGSNYLSDAIESALKQTYPFVEVLVINDGSTDNGLTEGIARSFGQRIRFYSKPNGGVASALNYGIDLMRGEYFSWLSHDDIYHPEKVEAEVAFQQERGKDCIVFCDYEIVDENNSYLRDGFRYEGLPEHMRWALLSEFPLNGCTLLIPKSVLQEVGKFDESLKVSQDYDLWFKIAGSYSFSRLPKVLVRSREHAEQGSRTMVREVSIEYEQYCLRCLKDIRLNKSSLDVPAPPQNALGKLAIRLQTRGAPQAARYARKMAWVLAKKGGIHEILRGAVWELHFRLYPNRGYRSLCSIASHLAPQMLTNLRASTPVRERSSY